MADFLMADLRSVRFLKRRGLIKKNEFKIAQQEK